MKRITLSAIRRITATEEAVIRAMMPKTSLADAESLVYRAFDRTYDRPVTKTLTYRMVMNHV